MTPAPKAPPTPGPWITDGIAVWNDPKHAANGQGVGAVADCDQLWDDETNAANARLIAAAPAMYEALAEISGRATTGYLSLMDQADYRALIMAISDIARSALAAAAVPAPNPQA